MRKRETKDEFAYRKRQRSPFDASFDGFET